MTVDHEEASVYILGAGASHEGGIPLSSQILPVGFRMLRDLRRRDRAHPQDDYLASLNDSHCKALERVYQFIACSFQGKASLDELDLERMPSLDELWGLLEIAYLRKARFGCDAAQEHSGRVRNALMTLMYHVLVGCRLDYLPDGSQQVCYDARTNPYDAFVRQLGPRDVVIALNYDTLLDRALYAAGMAIDYGTDFVACHALDGPRIRLLKLHGSFNWLFCPTCNTLQDFGGEDVAHIPLESNHPHEPCPLDGTPREYIIVPPSLIKSYDNLHLQRIWDSAAGALRTCSRLICVGYSMADSDIHVKYLVKQATSLNPAFAAPHQCVTVVTPSDESFEPYVRLFGEARVSRVPAGFGSFLQERLSAAP